MKFFCLINGIILLGFVLFVRFSVITIVLFKEYVKVFINLFRFCNRVCFWNFRIISFLEWIGKYFIRINFLDGMILIFVDIRKFSVL